MVKTSKAVSKKTFLSIFSMLSVFSPKLGHTNILSNSFPLIRLKDIKMCKARNRISNIYILCHLDKVVLEKNPSSCLLTKKNQKISAELCLVNLALNYETVKDNLSGFNTVSLEIKF